MPTLISLGLILGILVLQYVLWHRASAARGLAHAETVKMAATVEALTQQMLLVGQQVLPISTAFQTLLVKELTHFHTPRMDELLVKLGPPWTLSDAEETELLEALKTREKDMGDQITAPERDAAHIFPAIMRRVRVETANLERERAAFRLLTVLAPAQTGEK